jgi:hypothetical protein
MTDDLPEPLTEEQRALLEEIATSRARGEPIAMQLAARYYRSCSDTQRVEARALLHVARYFGHPFADGVLDCLSDDRWWMSPPKTFLWFQGDD